MADCAVVSSLLCATVNLLCFCVCVCTLQWFVCGVRVSCGVCVFRIMFSNEHIVVSVCNCVRVFYDFSFFFIISFFST